MTEAKTPQAGEWWVSKHSTLRVFIVGRTCSDRLVAVETKSGDVVAWSAHSFAGMYHEPDCTGWDWKPETWPKYFRSDEWTHCAFIRRDSEQQAETVDVDGRYHHYSWDKDDDMNVDRILREITEAEALARVKPAPVESPDDWVEITTIGHIIRPCDQCQAIGNREGFGWCDCRDSVGVPIEANDRLNYRCRRKDLPTTTNQPTRTPVRLWTTRKVFAGLNPWIVFASQLPPASPLNDFVEVKFDGSGFYVDVP